MEYKFQKGDHVEVRRTGERGEVHSVGELPNLGECYLVRLDGKRSSFITHTVDELEKIPANTVDKPAHYNQGEAIECIDAIRAALGDEFPAYCLGNVMKYTWRYKYKNGIEDLKKAQVYLGWAIDSLDDTESED